MLSPVVLTVVNKLCCHRMHRVLLAMRRKRFKPIALSLPKGYATLQNYLLAANQAKSAKKKIYCRRPGQGFAVPGDTFRSPDEVKRNPGAF